MASNDFAVSFYFELLFKGEKIAFQEITGLSQELNVEEIVSGGENRFKYKLPTTATYQNLGLKRALIPVTSKLVTWCKSTIGGGLINRVETNDVSVNLLGANQQVSMKWTFHKAWPVKYAFSDLRSQDNSLVIESIDLAYTYFEISSIKSSN